VKTIICLCHDVTDGDIRRAVELGYRHPETIKRFTASLMGPCQGKACRESVLDAISRHAGVPRELLQVPTARPPAYPIPMGLLAGGAAVDDG